MGSQAPKGRGKPLTIVLAVFLVAVVLVVAYWAFSNDDGNGGDGNGQEDELYVGDYLKYRVEADVVSSIILSTCWMNVTAVNETSYTFTIVEVVDDNEYVDTHTCIINRTDKAYYELEQIYSLEQDELSEDALLGVEALSTSLGNRTVKHYHIEKQFELNESHNLTLEYDIYVGNEQPFVYLIHVHKLFSGTELTMYLMETSVDWI